MNAEQNPKINPASIEDIYDIREKIGDGHFAEVNLCISRKTQKRFAAKFILKQRISNTTIGENRPGTTDADIDREAQILTNLQHENIVKLHEVFHEKDSVVLILDLVTGGELFARVAECERLSEEEASNFVEQVLLGVHHMHLLGVVHLDLKPENIMIEDLASRKIKIIDFGLARILNPNDIFQDMAGTPEFCAPEIIEYDPITFATDMWAIGVITYILLSGISPFAGDTQMETFQNILDCAVDYTREEIVHVTDLAIDFIRRLLVRNPRKRATVTDCLQHPWIKPSDSVQQKYRRGSVIRKQNLDSLRHFITVPSPPISPLNSIQLSDEQVENSFFTTPSPTPSNVPVIKSANIETLPPTSPTSDYRSSGRESYKENCQQRWNARMVEEFSETKTAATTVKQNEQAVQQPTEVNEPLTKSNPAAISAPSSSKPSTSTVSSWRNGFGSSIIERLGAAFISATSTYATSTTSSVSSSTQSGVSNKHSKNATIGNQSEDQSNSNKTDETAVRQESTRASLSDRVQDALKSNHQIDDPIKTFQLGTVSRAVREFETAVIPNMQTAQQSGSNPQPWTYKSHSLIPSSAEPLRIWNAHRSSRNDAAKPLTHTAPKRAHVGRLQEVFENQTHDRNKSKLSSLFSQRHSQG